MLAPDYRIIVVNNTGVQVDAGTVAVGLKEASGDGSGGASWGAEQTGDNAGSAIAAGTSETLVTVSGSTALALVGEAEGNLNANTATPDGDLEFYLETSTDGGGTWNRPPAPIAILNYPNAKSDKNTSFAA